MLVHVHPLGVYVHPIGVCERSIGVCAYQFVVCAHPIWVLKLSYLNVFTSAEFMHNILLKLAFVTDNLFNDPLVSMISILSIPAFSGVSNYWSIW